ncbi:hypothetical protein VCRA2119O147_730024 [Vibrio crassostreae]|nr:hypothetical protein VCRA2114E123_280045 [Vibrio crassostreae]CAK1942099.1 hypothetical protein VCRA2118O236_280046 [Vibrio crassostreae]CAK1944395.1 hypothetical protein VCRA2110O113_280046 [Vibrio crassostreae]CAK1946192.1 hypothetical protein VCRA2114E122_280045 [Vibrio crassostreae]CAK1958391.1 hypothetical protein VCRA2112O184_270003 [Vibrio crassostreae]
MTCFVSLSLAYICFIFLRALTFKAFTNSDQINYPHTQLISVNNTINQQPSSLINQ